MLTAAATHRPDEATVCGSWKNLLLQRHVPVRDTSQRFTTEMSGRSAEERESLCLSDRSLQAESQTAPYSLCSALDKSRNMSSTPK